MPVVFQWLGYDLCNMAEVEDEEGDDDLESRALVREKDSESRERCLAK